MSGAPTNTFAPYRQQWLDLRSEPILDPGQPIIDPHHHLWDSPRQRYLLPELIGDVSSGHNVQATLFVECHHAYRTTGPQALRPVGEVEFVAKLAGSPGQLPYPVDYCKRIVGHADLMLGDDVAGVLETLIEAANGRLAGIRHSAACDADPYVISPAVAKPRHMLLQPAFQRGFQQLISRGLSFDTFLYHTQIPDLTALARHFPQANIVLDHLGCPIGIGSYAGRRPEVFAHWSAALADLAGCPNVRVKLGGLGMQVAGFDLHHRPLPPTSEELSTLWKPYIDTCIELFGPARCMFESNFPPDKGTCSYGVLWNCFKRLTAGYSAAEKGLLFHDTAAAVYGLGSTAAGASIQGS